MIKPICIIPARMGSSRFPGKPLRPLLGMPLILHVLERCRQFEGFGEVAVATCDAEIASAVKAHGAKAVMTADTHDRATDRVEEAIVNMELNLAGRDLVVMVQGDEVLLNRGMIEDVVAAFDSKTAPVVNLASRLMRDEDCVDPNTVKVVWSPAGQALYFSRSMIPSRARIADASVYQQTGVMAFSVAFLHQFSSLPQTPLEKAESCDMMRVLEHGLPIKMVSTEQETVGVDTPDDLARAEIMLATDPVTATYLSR
jgi:3-deoxy-manno-octulosonate cytidylyltransferase (CMP-KDO synthetase)